jgi:hypothetical protein
MPSNLHLNVSEIISYADVSGHVEHCLTPIDSNMPTHIIAGIIDMDNITLCFVTRDLHHQLELRSPFVSKEPNLRNACVLSLIFRARFGTLPSGGTDVEQVDLTTTPTVCVIVCDHFRLLFI